MFKGVAAARIARRTINQLNDMIVEVWLTVQAMPEHDQRTQVIMVCVAPPALLSVATTNSTSHTSLFCVRFRL
ncbi:hypothetical protein A6A03_19405 [Chloroflexus islandicus]|uniref:Uncharacterized protein n=1 Tax=Chloroflexus islandicus TaxID=1707952 RepID=A0A178LYR2_9CHLR|nr:hypothetical protein A6A03_19405 [Chloroflexus islandicus]